MSVSYKDVISCLYSVSFPFVLLSVICSGVIAPYRRQVVILRHLLRERAKQEGANTALGQINVGTVDGKNEIPHYTTCHNT